MKKLSYFLLVALSGCLFVSCDLLNSSEEPTKTDSSSEFDGKWVEMDKYLITNEDMSYYLSQAVYFSDGRKAGDSAAEKGWKELQATYKDCPLTDVCVLEIGNGVIKVGKGSIYSNPSSSRTLWLKYNAYPGLIKKNGLDMVVTVGIEVKSWKNYPITVNKDGQSTFDNGQEWLEMNGAILKMLNSDRTMEFMTEEAFMSLSEL